VYGNGQTYRSEVWTVTESKKNTEMVGEMEILEMDCRIIVQV
jgi:hypothetical protein